MWSIELEKILKIYFTVHSDYDGENHKVSLELYERVEWVSYILWFHTLNQDIPLNIILIFLLNSTCHNRLMAKISQIFKCFAIFNELNAF